MRDNESREALSKNLKNMFKKIFRIFETVSKLERWYKRNGLFLIVAILGLLMFILFK